MMNDKKYKNFLKVKKDLMDFMWHGFPEHPEDQILCEMLLGIEKLRQDELDMADLKLLSTSFKELRYSFKLFKPYRSVRKAAVFGSARTPADHANYKLAKEFGRKIVKKGWMIITGGASGIMEAAMVGAGAKNSFGLNILLPFEQDANPVIRGNEKLIYFKYFFSRKLIFLKESEATVLFPGGFGTLDEGFESFTLVQTGKGKPRPLLLVDAPGSQYWKATLRLFKRNMADEKLISDHDMDLLRHTQDASEAVHELTHFYSNYHSSRFIKDRFLIRLRHRLKDRHLAELQVKFKDVLNKGIFERLNDLGIDDNKDASLERIIFYFNRHNFHRLRHLIDYFNQAASS